MPFGQGTNYLKSQKFTIKRHSSRVSMWFVVGELELSCGTEGLGG